MHLILYLLTTVRLILALEAFQQLHVNNAFLRVDLDEVYESLHLSLLEPKL